MSYAKRIAIDGPAGSGKSTLGTQLADKLGYVFIDAGVLYRAVTFEVLAEAVDINDATACALIGQRLRVEVTSDQDSRDSRTSRTQLRINDRLVGSELHTDSINQAVPVVAAHAEVRAAVRVTQAQIAQHEGIVFAGRDIGTVVLPDADLKLYLQVSLEERANRRFAGAVASDPRITRDHILEDLRRRDHLDTTRVESPLRMAPDAVMIVTDGMSPEAVLAQALRHAVIGAGGLSQIAAPTTKSSL